MAKRPRQHQLEDISILFFKSLLPPLWVCRQKDADYGVDLEVEVFDEDENSTGLTFIAQVKATDDPKKERSTSIKSDRLRYLASHDAPSMVVRYCHSTQTVHFAWVTNLFSQIYDNEAETVTLNFAETDVWLSHTPSALDRTLRTYRRLKYPTPGIPIGLTADTADSGFEQRYALDHAISTLRDLSAIFSRDDDPSICLPVNLMITDGGLLVQIDVLSSVHDNFSLNGTPEEIKSVVLYALALMCGKFGFYTQFQEICRMILEEGFTTKSRFAAAKVAIYAIDSPEIASELAAMNELHTLCDLHHYEYSLALQSSVSQTPTKRKAIERLISDTIEAHNDAPIEQQATLHYNFANFWMNESNYVSAVKHFNIARKKQANYLNRAYFLRELASCFYFRKKFAAAAVLYNRALELEPKSQVAICTGDALMYSGVYEDAQSAFGKVQELALKEGSDFDATEAWLKDWLCSCMPVFFATEDIHGTSWLSHRPFWMQHIEHAEANNRYDVALAAALMEGFRSENDDGLWADAIAFAFNTNDPALIHATLSCAAWRFGHRAYGKFRTLIKEMDLPTELIELLDTTVSDLVSKKQSSEHRRFVARFPDSANPESPHEVRIG